MKFKLLIIDDSKSIRHLLTGLAEFFLEEQFPGDWEIATAGDGEEAAELMKKETFNIIICDVEMPKMDGYAFLPFAKANYPGTPVVMMSGVFDQQKEKMFRDMGADGFLAKPFKGHDLHEMIEKLAFPEK